MSLVFYDTETTGVKTYFDQILQFAAIRTDADLNEIERFEIRSRLLPHVVPAPGAMKVTGVQANQLTDPNTPTHYEMVRAIQSKLRSWSPATFIGYNSIEFDEDLLRQALYKTLHSPYLTNTENNVRTDALKMVQASMLFAPQALVIPVGDNGKPSLKLDRLAPANGFAHKNAHDALADVEATIHICRLLIEKAPDIWSSFMRFSKKATVVDYVLSEPVYCLTEFYFNKPYSFLVTSLAPNPENSSEWYVFDLSVDPETLIDLTDEQLVNRLSRQPKPVRRLKANAAPILACPDDAPSICKALDVGMDKVTARADFLSKNEALRTRLIKLFQETREDFEPSCHVERQIYDGFPSKADQALMAAFHFADWPTRPGIVAKFEDPRLRMIGSKLIFLEHPELLEPQERERHEIEGARRLLGQVENVDWLILPEAIDEMAKLLIDAPDHEKSMLLEHQAYLLTKLDEAMAICA